MKTISRHFRHRKKDLFPEYLEALKKVSISLDFRGHKKGFYFPSFPIPQKEGDVMVDFDFTEL